MVIHSMIYLHHEIRFIEINPGDWWIIAADIVSILNYSRVPNMLRKLNQKQRTLCPMDTRGGKQKISVISEIGTYKAIFCSRKKEAEEFEDWVCNIIQSLRKSSSLEGFQIFRMLDKEHQREAMNRLNANLAKPTPNDFIKANTIANKAVSNMFRYPKSVKKGEMSPEMLTKRQEVIDETVNLIALNAKFNLGLSISQAVYARYQQ